MCWLFVHVLWEGILKRRVQLLCGVFFLFQLSTPAYAQNCDEIMPGEFCSPYWINVWPPWPEIYVPILIIPNPFNMPEPEGPRQDPDRPNFPNDITGVYGDDAEAGLQCILDNFERSPYLRGIFKDYSDVDISIVMTRHGTSCGNNTAACATNAQEGSNTMDIVRTKDGTGVIEINADLVESRRTNTDVGLATRKQVLAADILHEIGHYVLPGGGDHSGVVNGRIEQVPETHPDFPDSEMGKYMKRAWEEMFPGTLPPEMRVGLGLPPATIHDISQCFGGLHGFDFSNINPYF